MIPVILFPPLWCSNFHRKVRIILNEFSYLRNLRNDTHIVIYQKFDLLSPALYKQGWISYLPNSIFFRAGAANFVYLFICYAVGRWLAYPWVFLPTTALVGEGVKRPIFRGSKLILGKRRRKLESGPVHKYFHFKRRLKLISEANPETLKLQYFNW